MAFGLFDKRIQQQTRRVYNCWTPSYGRYTHAVVTELSLGHILPWIRRKRPSRVMKYPTFLVLGKYNTDEQLIGRHELKAARQNNYIMVKDHEGRVGFQNVYDLVDIEITACAQGGMTHVTPAELYRRLVEERDPPIPGMTAQRLQRVMRDTGYTEVDAGVFAIMVKQEEAPAPRR